MGSYRPVTVSQDATASPPSPASSAHTRKRSPATVALAAIAAALMIATMVLSAGLSSARSDLGIAGSRLGEAQVTLADARENLKQARESVQSKAADLARTQSDLASTQVALRSVQADLAATGGVLQQTRSTLSATSADLAKSRNDLASVSADLSAAMRDLGSARTELAKSLGDYSSQQAELKLAREQLSSTQTTLANLKTNYDRMTAGYGYVSRDPTYAQLKSFLQADTIDSRPYNLNTYNCVDFSGDLIANAFKAGVRAGYVNIDFPTQGHAVVVFNTTDRGTVYVEPQSDEEVNLRTGARYYQSIIVRPGYYYPTPAHDDTVVRYVVIW